MIRIDINKQANNNRDLVNKEFSPFQLFVRIIVYYKIMTIAIHKSEKMLKKPKKMLFFLKKSPKKTFLPKNEDKE